jgi:hypothetical protein
LSSDQGEVIHDELDIEFPYFASSVNQFWLNAYHDGNDLLSGTPSENQKSVPAGVQVTSANYCITWQTGGSAYWYINGQLVYNFPLTGWNRRLRPYISLWGTIPGTPQSTDSYTGPAALSPGTFTTATAKNVYLTNTQRSIDDLYTSTPSSSPSKSPSFRPTIGPSRKPTLTPSSGPSQGPSSQPSLIPSKSPFVEPSVVPSNSPLISPSPIPSEAPSVFPSNLRTVSPTIYPTMAPSQAIVIPTTLVNAATGNHDFVTSRVGLPTLVGVSVGMSIFLACVV